MPFIVTILVFQAEVTTDSVRSHQGITGLGHIMQIKPKFTTKGEFYSYLVSFGVCMLL